MPDNLIDRKSASPLPEAIDLRIVSLRGLPVLVDSSLAEVYGVPTKALNQAVKRNVGRFPEDFRFQLTPAELAEVVTNCDHLFQLRFSAVPPWAFTEHGAIMAASVLNSPRAIEMSVFIVRAFVRLRDAARTHADLGRHLATLERRVTGHDQALKQVFSAIRGLLQPPGKPKKAIGFRP